MTRTKIQGAIKAHESFMNARTICQVDNFFIEQGTQPANCTTGSVRLADHTVINDTIEGRVEVCINQAWGTVCEKTFDPEDAGTVCVATGGYQRNGKCFLNS